MNHLFQYDHLITGILILIVGFGFHWIGQMISIINWNYATKIGIQESALPDEFKVYEHAIAASDCCFGWIYGLAAVGLILNTDWGYKLAWFPGIILLYHSFNFWFWTKNRRKKGFVLESDTLRIGWSLANFCTGILAVLLAWNAN